MIAFRHTHSYTAKVKTYHANAVLSTIHPISLFSSQHLNRSVAPSKLACLFVRRAAGNSQTKRTAEASGKKEAIATNAGCCACKKSSVHSGHALLCTLPERKFRAVKRKDLNPKNHFDFKVDELRPPAVSSAKKQPAPAKRRQTPDAGLLSFR